ncbi:hypothetical protein LCGC14_1307020 [marine sediment metagenome]|uniref:Homing endonuclease LAGLIDADG domain-containing protein n=1 Tax=marine sediment metagenome TaxID=412755 RepID=A0A0F9L892_9ZZZZ|nr:hypothetical protein [bacterium]
MLNWNYIAGFVDGEGSIIVYEKRGKVIFQISNTDLKILESIKNYIGFGYIRVSHRNPEKWKPQGVYVVSRHEDVEKILKKLKGKIIVKNERLNNALFFIKNKNWERKIPLDIKKIRKMQKEGKSLIKIANEFGVGQTTIFNRLHE